jgi:cytoskeletal protein RodZ
MSAKSAVLPNLEQHRMAAGVTLSEIARTTCIGSRYLEAIEHGAFDKLPGGVYTVSYIRQYARAVGWDEAALVAYYREVSHTVAGD